MLDEQKKKDGECRITTVLFDNTYELLHDRIDIQAVHPMMLGEGTRLNYSAISKAVADYRMNDCISADALKAVRRDMKKRGKFTRNRR